MEERSKIYTEGQDDRIRAANEKRIGDYPPIKKWGERAEIPVEEVKLEEPFIMTEAEKELRGILHEAANLFGVKNAEYGNAIECTGVLGAVVAASGDIARLRQMILKNPDFYHRNPENVRDKFIDIVVQAAIGVYMVDKGNWIGREP